jgi:amidohydrolase
VSENRLLAAARGTLETMRAIRRDLHTHPELGMQETRTAGVIAARLRELGLEVRTGVGGTGVVGLLRGQARPGPREPLRTVALRADIDALPMQDRKQVPYASVTPGVAHSCGHDAHTAIQLGVAQILTQEAAGFPGNVKFIFQPSEDTLPGGAAAMIEAGALDDPPVDAIFTLHLASQFPQGAVVVKPGSVSTSSASFTLKIGGQGGHIGDPDKGLNPVLLAATLIATTESTLPKRVAPGEPLIFDFCSVHGGTAGNIVPDQVTLKGGLRAASPESLQRLLDRFQAQARGLVEGAGGTLDLELERGYPTIHNDPGLVELWRRAAAEVAGPGQVLLHDRLVTGGDDAAFFQQRVPGVYWFLGIRNPAKGYTEPLHSPRFDFDEDVLALGAAVQAQAALEFLGVGA